MQEKQVALLHKLKESVSTPEGVPRLFDLIKVQDERMKLAFFAALGNTVVAKDLDQVISSFFVTLWIILLIWKWKNAVLYVHKFYVKACWCFDGLAFVAGKLILWLVEILVYLY